jgi:hypothetical protein
MLMQRVLRRDMLEGCHRLHRERLTTIRGVGLQLSDV